MFHELHFVIRHQRVLERICQIEQEETTIGRSSANAIFLPDPYVSRQHAIILRTPQGFLIRDLGSRNGTRLNNQPLNEALLTVPAEIEIGPYSLKAFGDENAARYEAEKAEVSTIQDRVADFAGIHENLTPAQQRVYEGFLRGHSEKEVALSLDISVHTVHSHARAIYSVFAVSSRSELLAKFLSRQGK